MQEMRAHIRRMVQVEASIADAAGEHWQAVQMLDISRMGVAIASAAPIEGGTTRMLTFTLPGTTRRNEVVVKIVHCATVAGGGYRVGARFSAIDDDSAGLIAQFTGG